MMNHYGVRMAVQLETAAGTATLAKDAPPAASRAGQQPASVAANPLARRAELFFAFTGALSFSTAEEQALLDLSPSGIAALRAGRVTANQTDLARLERRLDYALPLLQRMLASISS